MSDFADIPFEPEKCEWNPKARCPARIDDETHGDATVSLGEGHEWHLCAKCAALPMFERFTVREPLPGVEDTP